MYRGILVLSFFAFLLGSHQANAAAVPKTQAKQYTADALAAKAIFNEARAGLKSIFLALNNPKNAKIDQLKMAALEVMRKLKAQFLPLEPSIEKLLRDDEKEFYKKTQDIRNENEVSLSLIVAFLVDIIEAKISEDPKVRQGADKLAELIITDFELVKTKGTETIAKLTALHNELKQLPRDVAEVTCASSSNQVRGYRLQHDALISAEVLFTLNAILSLVLTIKNKDRRSEIIPFFQTMELGMYDRITSTSATIGPALLTQSREVQMCKTNNHESNTTYTKLDPVFSLYIASKFGIEDFLTFDLNGDEDMFWHSDTCLGFQKDRKCSGKILECSTNALRSTYVCPADKNKSYRYEYLRFDDDVRMPSNANNKECPTNEVYLENYIGSVQPHCHFKHCTCEDEADDIVRHFSLKNTTSDVEYNKVVTGVRFRQNNYTIHLQVQQGSILKNGAIDQSSIIWKDIDTLSPLDPKAEEYRDFVTIRSDQRTICLENIDASQQEQTNLHHVLTGVRFATKRTDAEELYIEMEIQVTPYDIITGQLNPKKSVWFGNSETKKHEINGQKLVSSLSKVGRISQGCVSFTPSLMGDIDLGQSVVPRISLQELTVSPAVPLSGIGLGLDYSSIPNEPKGGTIQINGVFTFDIANYYSQQSVSL